MTAVTPEHTLHRSDKNKDWRLKTPDNRTPHQQKLIYKLIINCTNKIPGKLSWACLSALYIHFNAINSVFHSVCKVDFVLIISTNQQWHVWCYNTLNLPEGSSH